MPSWESDKAFRLPAESMEWFSSIAQCIGFGMGFSFDGRIFLPRVAATAANGWSPQPR